MSEGWQGPGTDSGRAATGSTAEVTRSLDLGLTGAQPPAIDRRLGRRRILLRATIPLAVLLLAAVAIGGFAAWSGTQFSVVERAGGVSVQHGVGPLATYEVTDVALAGLPSTARDRLIAHIAADDRQGVATVISGLRAQVATCDGSLEPPCPLKPLKAASVTLTPRYYPRGDEIDVSWDFVDGREGVVTKLLVNGKKGPKTCPTVLTTSGKCTIKGRFHKAYTVRLQTDGPTGATRVITQAQEHTQPKPAMTVRKGGKWTGKADDDGRTYTFCRIKVSIVGLDPYAEYKSTVLMSGHVPHKSTITINPDGEWRGTIFSYSDPTPGSWVAVDVADLKSKRLPWECGH